MKKVKLNKKLSLNKDVVSNLNSKHLIGIQGGTVQNCQPAIPDIRVYEDHTHLFCGTGGCSWVCQEPFTVSCFPGCP